MYFYTATPEKAAPFPMKEGFVFHGSMVWIGTFRCHPSDPKFGGTYHFWGHNMIVFPRTAVKLDMKDRGELIASPNTAVFYNQNTYYEREKLSEDGDQCELFQFDPTLLYDILREYAPARTPDLAPYPFTHALLSRENFLLQRRLSDLVLQQAPVSRLFIDETAVALLERIVIDSFGQYGERPTIKPKTQLAHRKLAREAQALLLSQFDRALSLQDVANLLFVSPYHLSRVFRQQVGCTLHQFLEQVRLRVAYGRLGDYRNNLSGLALELGYSSHSHFSHSFQQNFGFSPSTQFATDGDGKLDFKNPTYLRTPVSY